MLTNVRNATAAVRRVAELGTRLWPVNVEAASWSCLLGNNNSTASAALSTWVIRPVQMAKPFQMLNSNPGEKCL